MALARGEGVRVWDVAGNEYLDFFGGIAVNVLGHCHPAVVNAVTEQVQTLIHTTCLYYTSPQLELGQLLIENSCLDRVFYVNSGAEAAETAIKLARKWGKHHHNGAYRIITAENSFHGRTLGSLAATGQPHYHHDFAPLPAGFSYVPYNDLDALQAAVTDETVAIMLEPVMGEGPRLPGYRRVSPRRPPVVRRPRHPAHLGRDSVRHGAQRSPVGLREPTVSSRTS